MKTVFVSDRVTLILLIKFTGNSLCCRHIVCIVNVYVYKVLSETL